MFYLEITIKIKMWFLLNLIASFIVYDCHSSMPQWNIRISSPFNPLSIGIFSLFQMPQKDPFHHIIADFCVIPIGVETSLSKYIAACQSVLQASGLNYLMHAYGTNVQGPWDQVMSAIKECHNVVHSLGCDRVSTSIKIGTRIDKDSSINDKIQSVNDILQSNTV
jgi:uncharacterized protein (TIGR00106 family)